MQWSLFYGSLNVYIFAMLWNDICAKLILYFLLIFANFQSEDYCLSVNNVTDRDLKVIVSHVML